MRNVRQLLRIKGRRVWTISPYSTVLEALRLMEAKHIGSLIVIDGEEVVGIFTERDHARKIGLQNKQPKHTKVHEVMTKELFTVTPDQSVKECMALITEKRIRHLPVLEEGKVIGILSIGDILKDIIEELEFLVKQLEDYITGLR